MQDELASIVVLRSVIPGYVWDMLDAARSVREFTTGVSHDELGDRKLQLAVERALEIIGEAAGLVSLTFQSEPRRDRGRQRSPVDSPDASSDRESYIDPKCRFENARPEPDLR
jgi:hypothetical protein